MSVAFHFRDAADDAAAVVELETIAESAREAGFAARFGRKVLEVLPPVGSNKGTAVRHLLDGADLSRALVAGDDTTDLDAFRAVEELEHRVRVAVQSEESPMLLAEHAEIVLSSTSVRPMPAWTGVTSASQRLESRGLRNGTGTSRRRRPRWRAYSSISSR